ncbi:MAG TPA: hypothetical protein VFC67_09065 [Prolixibacteraceae bacterium]|nr:hypothetical protein [Prolixibacteraceae bacterium]
MKRNLFLICLFFLVYSIPAFTQSSDFLNDKIINSAGEETVPFAGSPIEKYLTAQQKSKGSDQLFVQLDRNIYKPRDTIYFKAYI